MAVFTVVARGPAQQLTIHDGARVRVAAPVLPAPLYGNAYVSRQPPGTVMVMTTADDARLSLPLAGVNRIDVSRGRPRLAMGAAGAGIGLILGSVLGVRAGPNDPEGFGALTGLMAGAGTGILVGAVAGAAYAPERWRTVWQAAAVDTSFVLLLEPGARTRRFADGTIAVRGERDRRAGMLRGAAAIGGVAVVFGGIDMARGDLAGDEYASAIFGNALVGAGDRLFHRAARLAEAAGALNISAARPDRANTMATSQN